MTRWTIIGLVLASLTVRVPLRGGEIDVVVGQRQLFLDDAIVAEARGFQRTMHSPEKRGAVIKPDIPSDGSRIQTYGSVPLWSPEERVFKMVYMAFPMENHDQIGAALAISHDGIHWEKPDLGQGVTVRGSSHNNRIYVDRDLRWGANALWNVICDEHDPDPSRRFKGLLGAEGRTAVVSNDCIRWEKLPGPKIPSHDTSTLTYDEQHQRYLAIVKTFNEYGRAASISMSKDFQDWSEPRPCFSTDRVDQEMALDVIRQRIQDRRYLAPQYIDPEPARGAKPREGRIPTWRAECYAFSVFPYEGVYLGLPMIYYPTGEELPSRNNTDGFHHIQLAMSRDLTAWTRLGERGVFIGPSPIDQGPLGVFDRQELIPPSRPVVMGDELWFYYTGFKSRIPPYTRSSDGSPRNPASLTMEEQADLAEGWSAICLAVLRRDGFVSLDAGPVPGTLLTKPFTLQGTNLFVNVDASAGDLRVEVLNEKQESVCLSGEIHGNQPHAKVSWTSGGFSQLKGETVRLRLTLRNAKLYSFWVEETE